MGEGTGQEEQKTSGEGANTTFWDQLHLTVPTGGCHLPGNQAQGASECQAWPRPEPTAWQGLAVPSPACMKCSSHQKEQIQRFILSTWCPEHGGRGRTHPHSPCPADTSIPASSPVHRCHHVTQMCSPQKATRHLGCVFLQPKSHDCHQGEKNSAVRTSETKKDALLGCFFSIRFFFFYEKRSHGVLQQTECQKNCFKQNINKTKQKDKNLALLSSRLSEISLCSIEGSGF